MAEQIRAEMVASILQVQVAIDEQVEEGQSVVLLESMKMEIPVLTETAGRVSVIAVKVGDVVQAGDLLIEIE